jgi:hypothetical protein
MIRKGPRSVADPDDPNDFGPPDLDPFVRGTDPDPSIIKQNSKRNLDSYCFVTGDVGGGGGARTLDR